MPRVAACASSIEEARVVTSPVLDPAALGRPEQRAAGERLGRGRHGRELAAERGEQEGRIHFPCEIACRAVEFGREVAGVDRVRVGVDREFGIGHVVTDERDGLGHGAGAHVGGRDGRPGVGERAGEPGSRADADLDESIEVGEARCEGTNEGSHDGAFIIRES